MILAGCDLKCKKFLIYKGRELDDYTIRKALFGFSKERCKVKVIETRDHLMFYSLLNGSYEEQKCSGYPFICLQSDSYNATNMSAEYDKLRNLYSGEQLYDKIMFSVANADCLTSFCGAIYDYKSNILTIANINGFDDIYYGYTKSYNELVYSNDMSTLKKLCKKDTIVKLVGDKYVMHDDFQDVKLDHGKMNTIVKVSKEQRRRGQDIDFRKNSKNYTSIGTVLNNRNYSFDPSLGRDKEVLALQRKLLIPKQGVILIGKSGVGKSAIVNGLAYRIKQGQVCDQMKDKVIVNVMINNLVAGTRYRGDMEEKIKNVCESIAHDKNAILFLDELHTSINAGETYEGNLDIANILMPYIDDNMINVVGCTTPEGYQLFSQDKAFRGRFNPLEVKELDDDKIKAILIENIYNNSFKLDVDINDEDLNNVLDIILELSRRKQKMTGQTLSNPKASINILMECMADMVVNNNSSFSFGNFVNSFKCVCEENMSDFEAKILLKNFNKKGTCAHIDSEDEMQIENSNIKVYRNYYK